MFVSMKHATLLDQSLACICQYLDPLVVADKGCEPEWNENFVFTVSNNVSEFKIRLMDSDSGNEDDFVGEVE